jgi:diadenosine tetraphosphate (Ap4A) HIT family hydrolase
VTAGCDLCRLLAGFDAAAAGAASTGPLVWRDDRLAVILVDEPGYPGFARVVWHDHVREMTDLSPQDRDHVMRAVWAVEQAQRETMSPHKVNVASFGNMTPHVHWHVIPRYTDDAHFPNPTWGAKQREPDAAAVASREALLPQLRAAIVKKLNHA